MNRNEIYKLYVDLTQAVKKGFRKASNKEMEEAIKNYMKLLNPPDDVEITLSPNEIKQTSLLAAQALTRQLYERFKK